MEDGSKLLVALLKTSEKAANIARACRQDDTLFKILVQEKSEEEKNPRFFRDFKTLADVLIQETVRHDIAQEFPELSKMVQGEENNTFSNALGETVTVEVCSNLEETGELLAKVMDGNSDAAKVLATEVHRDIEFKDVPTILDVPTNFCLTIEDLGIWIDPIDSTADYIAGAETIDEETGLYVSGLRCVTVLIGVYDKSSGTPILGVVNQPFHDNTNSQWKGVCYWGYAGSGERGCSIRSEVPVCDKVIVLSRAEDSTLRSKLSKNGFTLVEVAGAGYKLLSVAVGKAAAYVLSKGSTYRWDTCGPQAVLRSLGGGVVRYKEFTTNPESDDTDVKYLPRDANFANSDGLIAFRDPKVLRMFRDILCE